MPQFGLGTWLSKPGEVQHSWYHHWYGEKSHVHQVLPRHRWPQIWYQVWMFFLVDACCIWLSFRRSLLLIIFPPFWRCLSKIVVTNYVKHSIITLAANKHIRNLENGRLFLFGNVIHFHNKKYRGKGRICWLKYANYLTD